MIGENASVHRRFEPATGARSAIPALDDDPSHFGRDPFTDDDSDKENQPDDGLRQMILRRTDGLFKRDPSPDLAAARCLGWSIAAMFASLRQSLGCEPACCQHHRRADQAGGKAAELVEQP